MKEQTNHAKTSCGPPLAQAAELAPEKAEEEEEEEEQWADEDDGSLPKWLEGDSLAPPCQVTACPR